MYGASATTQNCKTDSGRSLRKGKMGGLGIGANFSVGRYVGPDDGYSDGGMVSVGFCVEGAMVVGDSEGFEVVGDSEGFEEGISVFVASSVFSFEISIVGFKVGSFVSGAKVGSLLTDVGLLVGDTVGVSVKKKSLNGSEKSNRSSCVSRGTAVSLFAANEVITIKTPRITSEVVKIHLMFSCRNTNQPGRPEPSRIFS